MIDAPSPNFLLFNLFDMRNWNILKQFEVIPSYIHTLFCRIDVQGKINMQEGKFWKNIKRAGQNRRTGGNFFSKALPKVLPKALPNHSQTGQNS